MPQRLFVTEALVFVFCTVFSLSALEVLSMTGEQIVLSTHSDFLSKYIKSVSTYTRIRQFPRRSHRQVGVEIRISSTVHFMAS